MDKSKTIQPWLKNYDSNVPESINYPDININELLNAAFQNFPEATFLQYNDTSFSYRTIHRLICNLAGFLNSIGVKKGDRVGIVLPNIPQFVIAYYAILRVGAIVVAMNPRYKQKEFIGLLNHAGVSTVICTENLQSVFLNIQKNFAFVNIITTKTEEYLDIQASTNPQSITNRESEVISFASVIYDDNYLFKNANPKIDGNDAAIFQFSGGTTGTPKPAVGMHKNIVANSIQFSKWCNLIPGKEVILAAIPLYHVYGMVLAMNMGVAIGAKIILISDPTDIDNILRQIGNHRVTFYPGVPTMYQAINKSESARSGKYDLRSIKACISGSFTLHPKIKEDFEKLTGGKLLEGYGLSEAPTATHCNPLLGMNKIGSIGMPLPDVEAKIVDVETGQKDKDVGEVGEMVLRGPQVMREYFRDPEETAITIRNGWLYTGDIARMDSDGYFYILDRKKSLIKVNGLQVWPGEVEAELNSHPEINECVVGGVPDYDQGEKVICWYTANEQKEILEQDLRNWLSRKLVHYKIPREYYLIKKIPRTGVGKVLRRELVAAYKNKSADQ